MTHQLLDVGQITKNMREFRTGTRSVLAKRHKPYAKSSYGNHVHRVIGVRVDYRTDDHRPDKRITFLAVYVCGAASMYPEFYKRPPRYRPRCHRCFEKRA